MSEGKGAYRIALGTANTGGGVASALNPEAADLIITDFVIDVTTAPTGASLTADAGIAATATGSDNTLIAAADLSAVGMVAAGNPVEWPSGEYLTVSRTAGGAAGLVGYAYVKYVRK